MCILILILIFQASYNPIVYANDKTTYYARIMFEQTYLYKTPKDNNDVSNVFFVLPKTYFVELTNEEGNFYKVNYMDLIGYVKKDSVQAISGTPSNPYLKDITFRVYAELSRDLRSAPNTDTSTQINMIPLLTKNITYYGELIGQCLIEGRTNIWYYCKYSADKDYYGYVYSDFCDEKATIIANNEEVTYIDNPSFIKQEIKPQAIPTNSKTSSIIIAILSVPALIFVILIIKGKKILTREKLKSKEVIDY